VFREYERSMATILNVYVMPGVGLRGAARGPAREKQKVAAPLLLMKSNGGVTGASTIRRRAGRRPRSPARPPA
jgi:N-methylhydantoinase A